MKTLSQRIKEKLVMFPSQVNEKLVVNKNYTSIYNYYPKDRNELNIAIQEHYDKDIYDLNDIDVSKITDFNSLFEMDKNTGNKDFNISEWDVSNGEDFSKMFRYCTKLNCNLSKWNVSNGILFNSMFFNCYKFNSDLNNWDVSKGENFSWMFYTCYEFNCDLSKWKIKDTAKTTSMFNDCDIEDKYKPSGVK
ncbi:MAG: BspA family leucine-rich repeat surface protein [Methanobrevibacter sp.]|nr:BspA family leucine-rich repeat surface protein [Methanobrevibacter sp.]